MKRQKDLFDLFRENEQKLEEMPSPQAWRRLERKLDNRRRTSRRDKGRWQPMMMAAALLLLAVITFLFSLVLDQNKPAYLAVNEQNPLPMEELTYTDVDQGAMRAVEFTRKYQDRMSNPIVEGTTDQRLVPSDDVLPELRRMPRAPRTEGMKDALLSNFYWLLGTWTRDQEEMRSGEQWELINENTLEGSGWLSQDGDTIFQEKMSLQVVDNRLYFFAELDQSRQPVRYELLEQAGRKFIFENTTIPFPQRVILENEDSGKYQLIMENSHPSQLTRAQADFIGRRNELQNQQAVREMVQVKK